MCGVLARYDLGFLIVLGCRYASLLGDDGGAVVTQKVYWNDKCPSELLVCIQVADGSIDLADIMPQAPQVPSQPLQDRGYTRNICKHCGSTIHPKWVRNHQEKPVSKRAYYVCSEHNYFVWLTSKEIDYAQQKGSL